jgi:hypothetical protein
MKKPLKVKILSFLYILAGLLLIPFSIVVIYLHFTHPDFIPTILWELIPEGAFYAGDTSITINQIYLTILFLLPMFIINGTVSIIGGYLALKSEKKLAWYLMLASSMLYCLVIVGLIVDYIFLQDDIKSLYTS